MVALCSISHMKKDQGIMMHWKGRKLRRMKKYFWNGFLEDTCTNIKITSNRIKVNLPAAPFRLYSIRVPISNHVEFQIFQTQ